jgi:pre-rRNA-processing protein IPI3
MAFSKPPDLVGCIQLAALSGPNKEETIPVRPIQPFARTRDPKGKPREVSVFLPQRSVSPYVVWLQSERYQYAPQAVLPYDYQTFSSDQAYFASSLAPSNTVAKAPNNAIELQARIGTLEAEVSHLKSQLDKAQGINDSMWEGIVKGVLAGGTLRTDTVTTMFD